MPDERAARGGGRVLETSAQGGLSCSVIPCPKRGAPYQKHPAGGRPGAARAAAPLFRAGEWFRRLLWLALIFLPVGAGAHPHVFVATGLRLVAEEGRITGVEVAWQYDALYSLLVLEEMNLDQDYDGVLNEDELARLEGFDMNWIEGFEGDLYLTQGGAPLTLGPPEPRGTAFEAGQIVTRHFRAVEAAEAGPVVVRAYDPTFYTAYDLELGIEAPEGCSVVVDEVDFDATKRALLKELAEIPEDGAVPFPEVGAKFADRVEVTCDAP